MEYGVNMTKQEILERVQNIIHQYPGEMIGDLDLLRHDLENDVIVEQQFNRECG